MKTLGEGIKHYRLVYGLKQHELAEGICTIDYIRKIENGSRRPSAELLSALLNKLHISHDDFMRYYTFDNPTRAQQVDETINDMFNKGDFDQLDNLLEDYEDIDFKSSSLLREDLLVAKLFKRINDPACLGDTLVEISQLIEDEEINVLALDKKNLSQYHIRLMNLYAMGLFNNSQPGPAMAVFKGLYETGFHEPLKLRYKDLYVITLQNYANILQVHKENLMAKEVLKECIHFQLSHCLFNRLHFTMWAMSQVVEDRTQRQMYLKKAIDTAQMNGNQDFVTFIQKQI